MQVKKTDTRSHGALALCDCGAGKAKYRMKYFSTTGAASRRATTCLVVGIYGHNNLGIAATDIDSASNGVLTRLIKQGDLSAAVGQ
jgi:hypothetical protein